MARGFAIPIYSPSSREDAVKGGQVLFRNFVREEFEHEGLPDPSRSSSFDEGGDAASANLLNESDRNANSLNFAAGRYAYGSAEEDAVDTQIGYKNETWSRYGRDLRLLADDFSRSRQGEEVRRQADTVNLLDLNKERFLNLLLELFSEGFSTERLLALFCFCTNLLVRSAREKGGFTRLLFVWSLDYIKDKVCNWVYEHGGWGKVLGGVYNIMSKVLACGALIVVIVAGGIYIKKNW